MNVLLIWTINLPISVIAYIKLNSQSQLGPCMEQVPDEYKTRVLLIVFLFLHFAERSLCYYNLFLLCSARKKSLKLVWTCFVLPLGVSFSHNLCSPVPLGDPICMHSFLSFYSLPRFTISPSWLWLCSFKLFTFIWQAPQGVRVARLRRALTDLKLWVSLRAAQLD